MGVQARAGDFAPTVKEKGEAIKSFAGLFKGRRIPKGGALWWVWAKPNASPPEQGERPNSGGGETFPIWKNHYKEEKHHGKT